MHFIFSTLGEILKLLINSITGTFCGVKALANKKLFIEDLSTPSCTPTLVQNWDKLIFSETLTAILTAF